MTWPCDSIAGEISHNCIPIQKWANKAQLCLCLQAKVGGLAFPNVTLREEALSPFPPSQTELVAYFRHRGLFDQTPTSLSSFLTCLTSNVWHSRLAADQLTAPRQGPTRPGQMPLLVGPDHMHRGQARAPRELPHPHTLHRTRD